MKTYQKVNSRGVECERQQGLDWDGLVTSRQPISKSAFSLYYWPQNELLVTFLHFLVRLMLHLHAGPRIMCVTGCRSRVSVCMSTWHVCGFPPVRLFYRPHKQTSRG